jgi:hypothetical protein
MQYLRQSTAATLKIGPFVDDSDGNTVEDSLTISQADVRLSKNGGNIAQKNEATSCTHDELGVYGCPVDATDTGTLGRLQLWVHESGALPVWHEFMVVPANVWDSFFGSDNLEVDTVAVSGDATAADNLELACDNYSVTRGLTGTAVPDAAADAAGGLPISDAGALDLDAMDAQIDAIETDTQDIQTQIGAAGAGLTGLGGMSVGMQAEIESECNDALVAQRLDHLVAVADADDPVNDSIIAKLAASDGDWSGFDEATDSLEAIRDRGDAAWITGAGGGITDILNVQPVIPDSIDLANTATVRLALGLTNALDDLPSTAEIDPGTITIDRKAIGGTSWTNVVNAAACSEAAGLVYYDEVFDAGTGYAEGDSIRVTFRAQKITVAANDYEITGTDGWMFQTSIRETMRGTDGANVTTPPTATAIVDEWETQSQADPTGFHVNVMEVNGTAQTANDHGADLNTLLTRLSAANAQALADWIDGGRLDLIIDAILTDTNELQADDVPGLIAALNDLSSADIDTALATYDGPTNAEMIARTLVAAAYFDPATDPVATVTDVTNQVSADVTAVSGDAAAADNLESQYDGTGLSGDTYPARQDQLDQIALTGAAINAAMESYTLTTGTESSGTEADTVALDGTNHEHTDDAGSMDLYYQFDVGGDGVPTSITVTGYLNGNNDDLEIYAYNWGGASWDQIGVLGGKAASTNEVNQYTLFTSHVGTGANLGKVRIRFTDGAFTLTTATLAVDQIYVSYAVVARSVGYADGAIWVDTNASNANTEPYVDGVADNPVSTWAAALTLSASLNIVRFRIKNGSSITLSANSDNYTLIGDVWTLALNGQSIAGLHAEGAEVNGVGTGATPPSFENCHLGSATLPPAHLTWCGLSGTFTIGSEGDFFFDRCHSGIAGTSVPVLDFGALRTASDVNFRGYSGGIEVQNMGAGAGSYNMSLEGYGQIILNANCTGGTIAIRGAFTVTDNAGGAVTLSDDARYDVGQINDEVDTGLVDYDGPTRAEMDAGHALLATEAKQDIIDTVVDAIKAVTDLLPDAGALNDLALILTDTNELQGDWTDGGRLDLILDAVLADTNELQSDDVPGLIAALENLSAAAVNAEMLDVLTVDTFAEPGQGAPAATTTIERKIAYVFKFLRNRVTSTATQVSVYNDAGAVIDHKSTVSDDLTTYDRGEFGSGP